MTRQDLVDLSGDEELLFADGFDEALIGIVTRCGQPTIVVYDRDKCHELLVAQGLSDEEAIEHFEYNVVGSWVGKRTPAYLCKPESP